MKRFLICLFALLMLVPAVDAKRKKDKAGKIKGGTYLDKKYEFQMAMHDGWKVNIHKNSEPVRLTFVQKNYLIPSDYKNTPDFTKVPRLSVYVDTTSLSVYAFVDSLLSDSYESKQKKNIQKEFDLLTISNSPKVRDVIPRGSKRGEIAGQKTVVYKAQAKYVEEVPVSASSSAGKRVYGEYGGSIVGLKKGDTVYLFHIMCEWQYFNDVFTEAYEIINSIDWPEGE